MLGKKIKEEVLKGITKEMGNIQEIAESKVNEVVTDLKEKGLDATVIVVNKKPSNRKFAYGIFLAMGIPTILDLIQRKFGFDLSWIQEIVSRLLT